MPLCSYHLLCLSVHETIKYGTFHHHTYKIMNFEANRTYLERQDYELIEELSRGTVWLISIFNPERIKEHLLFYQFYKFYFYKKERQKHYRRGLCILSNKKLSIKNLLSNIFPLTR